MSSWLTFLHVGSVSACFYGFNQLTLYSTVTTEWRQLLIPGVMNQVSTVDYMKNFSISDYLEAF